MESKIEPFDKAIALGKSLLPYPSVRDSEYEAKLIGWETNCMHLLEQAFGVDSVYTRKFDLAMSSADQAHLVSDGLEIMEMARDQIEVDSDSTELDRMKEEVEKGKAEAERRATVVETKLWGAVIELIDYLRDELKKRSERDQQILDMNRQLKDIKQLLIELSDKA